uniref:Uncharacterized protein n=1 Tax=Arundo donax TaxID=35708 RepID=A0A0A9GMV6_ARUDO
MVAYGPRKGGADPIVLGSGIGGTRCLWFLEPCPDTRPSLSFRIEQANGRGQIWFFLRRLCGRGFVSLEKQGSLE